VGENFPVTLLSHCPHPLIFVNKLVCVVLVYSYFGLTRLNMSRVPSRCACDLSPNKPDLSELVK
jgi:hypothetical protein